MKNKEKRNVPSVNTLGQQVAATAGGAAQFSHCVVAFWNTGTTVPFSSLPYSEPILLPNILQTQLLLINTL